MQYSNCGLYCASKQANIIDDRSEFLTLLANFNFDSIWVNTESNVTSNQGHLVYELFLGNHMIYPTNTINAKNTPKLFHYHNGAKTQISSIEVHYKYYDQLVVL